MATTPTGVPRLGGDDGSLICSAEGCHRPRWETHELCPACWGATRDGGTRNGRGVVLQARLPKPLWMATNFAAKMLRDGTYRTVAIARAARYYDVAYEDVQRALSQRSGRSQAKPVRHARKGA